MESEHTGDEEWVTVLQASRRWGIKYDSARLKLKRYGWEAREGNNRKKRYRVPEGYRFDADMDDSTPDQAEAVQKPDERPSISPSDASALADAVATLRQALDRAEARADDLQKRLDAATARADAAQAALEDERRKGLWTRIREAWGGR